MTRRFRHKARGLCPLAPTGITCHAFGAETACQLCDMLDLDHPTSAVTLGRADWRTELDTGEQAFWTHLGRRTDGGPKTPAELAAKRARGRDRPGARTSGQVAAAVIAASGLPREAPF